MRPAFQSRGYSHYFLAGGMTALALAITVRMRVYGEHKQLLLFLAAVVFSAVSGHWRAGLVTAALSAASYALFIAEPIGTFAIDDPADARRLLVFAIAALAMLVAFAARERATAKLRFREEMLSLSLAAGRIHAWSANFTSGGFWGATGGDGLANTYEAFVASVHPDDRRAFMRTVDAAMGVRADVEVIHRLASDRGHHRWVSTRMRVHLDMSRRPAYLIGASIQVDRRRQAVPVESASNTDAFPASADRRRRGAHAREFSATDSKS